MSALIKLLFIIDCYKSPHAGTEGQLLKLISHLDKDKYSATFIVFKNSNYLRDNLFPIPVEILDIHSLSSPASWFRLFKCFAKKKKEHYGLAHIFFNDASMICPPILKLLGYRVVISRRDMGYWYTRMKLMVLKFNSLFVDRVITNSEAVKKITIDKEGYRSEKVVVINNSYYDTVIKSLASTNDSFGKNEYRIVLVANIRPIKRIEDAIYATNIIREVNVNAVLYIIGDGSQSELMELSETLGITGNVRFLGPRDDVVQLLPNFHVGILCSESEGFSNTLIEYMQSGLPIVCSNVGGNPEIIEHNVNGYLYDVGDVQSLAKYIIKISEDDQLCISMGHAGKEKVKNNYSLSKYIERHKCIYEKLLTQ